jgi:hypothetical protein
MFRVAFAALAVVLMPSAAMAQSISGELSLHRQYLDDDLAVYTNEPVVQAGLYLDVSEQCSLDAWGSHGLATSEGAEFDLGASCRFTLSPETEVEVVALRSFLHGVEDITELTVGVTHGALGITVSHYLWDNNPDATRITVGYTVEASEKLSLRPQLVYQTGFGEADVAGGGLTASYKLTDQLSLVGTVLTPFTGERNTEANIGISYTF